MIKYSLYSNVQSSIPPSLWFRREGYNLKDSNNDHPATIMPPVITHTKATNHYAEYDDNNTLNVATNNITLFAMCNIWEADGATAQTIIGKQINGNIDGRCALTCRSASGKVALQFRVGGTTYSIDSSQGHRTDGVLDLYIAEIDTTNKKARLFLNGVQQGADTTFTGDFPASLATALKFRVGAATTDGTTILPSSLNFAFGGLYKRLLTPTEKATLLNRGYVSGAEVFYVANNVYSYFDISGNNRHAVFNANTVVRNYNSKGSGLPFDYGCSIYEKNAASDIYVPFDVTGNPVTISAGTHIPADYTVKEQNEADSLGFVNYDYQIDFDPADSNHEDLQLFNRSLTDIFEDAARGADYSAGNPYLWHQSKLNREDLTAWYKTAYKWMIFPKFTGNSVSGRNSLNQILVYWAIYRESRFVDHILALTGDTSVVTPFVTPTIYELDSIYYKYDSIHVDTIRGDYALANTKDRVWVSSDKGASYTKKIKITDLGDELSFSIIFLNGTVFFGNNTTIYKTDVSLASASAIAVKRVNGADFVPNTGSNFKLQNYYPPVIVGDKELFTWTNYSLTTIGTFTTNQWYLFDDSTELKSGYEFAFSNPSAVVRHGHAITYDHDNENWVMTTGDDGSDPQPHCHIMTGVYNNGSWTWTIAYSGRNNSYFKASSEYRKGGYCYWAGDYDTVGVPSEINGVYKCLIADRGTSVNYIKLYEYGLHLGNFTYFDSNMVARIVEYNHLLIGTNNGASFEDLTITTGVPANVYFYRSIAKNSAGWLKLDASPTNVYNKGTLWIKFK